jgi:hypothetical protein
MGTGAYSVIDLQDLSCQDNRGRIGGSLFTQRSTISMRRMIFRNNRVESTVFPGVPLIIGKNFPFQYRNASFYSILAHVFIFFFYFFFLNSFLFFTDLQADQWQNTGGAIAVFKSNVTADEMTFANNYSEDEAGAIYVARGRLTISRTYAEGNSARWGGFINAHSAPDTFLFVDNLNCYRNIADDKIYNLYALGGCIFAEDVVTLVVVDSIMTQNVALGGVRLRGYGAAVSFCGSNVEEFAHAQLDGDCFLASTDVFGDHPYLRNSEPFPDRKLLIIRSGRSVRCGGDGVSPE